MDTFPLLKLPVELQINIFTEALIKPAINFCTLKAHPAMTSPGSFDFEMAPCLKRDDDSAYLYYEEIQKTCEAAATAVRLAKKFDLLCIAKDTTYRRRRYLNPTLYHWKELRQRNDQAEHKRIQALFHGHGSVGISLSFYGKASPEFDCNLRDILHESFCPSEVAAFMDLFPDLKEFYLVLGMRVKPGSVAARCMWKWTDAGMSATIQTRQSSAISALLTWCITGPHRDLITFRGKNKRYTEVHDTPCQCPIADACLGPKNIGIKKFFNLLQETKEIFLKPANGFEWSLPLSQRQKVKFTILVQEYTAYKKWEGED